MAKFKVGDMVVRQTKHEGVRLRGRVTSVNEHTDGTMVAVLNHSLFEEMFIITDYWELDTNYSKVEILLRDNDEL